MPAKNKGKGGKKKRRAGGTNTVTERNVLLSDGPQQIYGQALKMLGDRRILANCYNPKTKTWSEKMVHVRGKFRKRVWVNINDFVLVSTREFETGNESGDDSVERGGDIIHVYQSSEIRKLVKAGAFKLPGDDGGDGTGAGGRRVYIDSDDEDIEPNMPIEDEDGDDKPKPVEIAAQTRYLGMPSSDEESEYIDDLEAALANL
jgi:translation initiation factor 1A